jgi:uncharacterized protein (TIGR01777 family)
MEVTDTDKILLLTGATGLVGRAYLPRLVEAGWRVRALTRSDPSAANVDRVPGVDYVKWDGTTPDTAVVAGCDAVLHLAGEPLFAGPATEWRCKRIRDSRIEPTKAIVKVMGSLSPALRPKLLICASAVGIYGDGRRGVMNEASAPGRGFLPRLCTDWEAAAEEARDFGTHVVRMRFGVILSREGGALAMMRMPFDYGVGGRLGNGRQTVPWVHLDDVLGALDYALEGRLDGPVNVVAPESVTNGELTTAIAKRLGKPERIPVPAFVLRSIFADIADELVGSKQVSPSALNRAHYRFVHPHIDSALDAALL